MIAEICKDKEGQNPSTCRLRGRYNNIANDKEEQFSNSERVCSLGLTEAIKEA
jgi:hypothetical protein